MELAENFSENATAMTFKGKLTFADYKHFQDVFQRLEQAAPKQVNVHLAELEFIDSSGIGMLLLLKEKCDQKSVALVVHNPQGQVKKMFEVAQLDKVFSIAS
ncbi:MAG: STAS domain-containing protein [Rickettsiales bacterium]